VGGENPKALREEKIREAEMDGDIYVFAWVTKGGNGVLNKGK